MGEAFGTHEGVSENPNTIRYHLMEENILIATESVDGDLLDVVDAYMYNPETKSWFKINETSYSQYYDWLTKIAMGHYPQELKQADLAQWGVIPMKH